MQSLDDLNKKLEEQIDTFGKSSIEIEIYRLRKKGATDEDVAFTTQLSEQIRILENAKAITADGIAPLDKFGDSLSKIYEALDAGKVTNDAAGGAIAKLFDELDKSSKTELHSPAALGRGSKEAESTILRAQQQDQRETVEERIERVIKQQLDVAQQAKIINQQMLDALRNRNVNVAAFN